MADRWIVIPGWDKFQHRDAGRSRQGFTWLRDHSDQLHKDDYRALTFHQRGLLKDLRHSYATARGQLSGSTLSLTRRLGQRVSTRDLERLAGAGFIALSASKPAALMPQDCQPRKEVDKETKGKRRKPVDNGARRCPECGLTLTPPLTLTEHIHLQHGGGDAP